MKSKFSILLEVIYGPILAGIFYWLLFNSEGPLPSWAKYLYSIFIIIAFINSIILFLRQSDSIKIIAGIFNITMVVTVSILLFALIYKTVGISSPDGQISHSPNDALYFSIVTWTTLGYGDFQPVQELRFWAAFEALLGYIVMAFYIGLFINFLKFKKH